MPETINKGCTHHFTHVYSCKLLSDHEAHAEHGSVEDALLAVGEDHK